MPKVKPKTFSTVIRWFNRCNEYLGSHIVDSTSRSGATRKANGWLKDTFLKPVKKFNLDNYQYWDCYDIADIQLGRIEENAN